MNEGTTNHLERYLEELRRQPPNDLIRKLREKLIKSIYYGEVTPKNPKRLRPNIPVELHQPRTQSPRIIALPYNNSPDNPRKGGIYMIDMNGNKTRSLSIEEPVIQKPNASIVYDEVSSSYWLRANHDAHLEIKPIEEILQAPIEIPPSQWAYKTLADNTSLRLKVSNNAYIDLLIKNGQIVLQYEDNFAEQLIIRRIIYRKMANRETITVGSDRSDDVHYDLVKQIYRDIKGKQITLAVNGNVVCIRNNDTERALGVANGLLDKFPTDGEIRVNNETRARESRERQQEYNEFFRRYFGGNHQQQPQAPQERESFVNGDEIAKQIKAATTPESLRNMLKIYGYINQFRRLDNNPLVAFEESQDIDKLRNILQQLAINAAANINDPDAIRLRKRLLKHYINALKDSGIDFYLYLNGMPNEQNIRAELVKILNS